jgi:hypothetical protein
MHPYYNPPISQSERRHLARRRLAISSSPIQADFQNREFYSILDEVLLPFYADLSSILG